MVLSSYCSKIPDKSNLPILSQEVFVSENLGSQTSINNTIVEDTVQTLPFVIVKALNGGRATVSYSTFARNRPVKVRYFVLAFQATSSFSNNRPKNAILADVDSLGDEAETVVTISDSDFSMNQGAGDAFILARNTSALVDMSRNRIEGNTGSLVSQMV